ncbi:MAG: ATP-binding protein [Candidatus Cloacimonadota bacterium]|nr:ATP-binding protein [Candidatus Cloacimonadota bacterium]
MKELVIISGKGGTGKTSFAASFAYLAGENAVLADYDVDASDLHILLEPKIKKTYQFYGGKKANIIREKCIGCGKCQEICRFDAVKNVDDKFEINKIDCEGCGYCYRICPVDAIKFEDNLSGKWYISKTRRNSTLVFAKLGIAEENSGKLVSKIKEVAHNLANENNKDLLISDGAPGIGCPVIASLSNANYVLIVTEPSLSGFHDLKRILELVKHFGYSAGCIINKYDINENITKEIEIFSHNNELEIIGKIPYSDSFPKSLVLKQTVVEYDKLDIGKTVERCWSKLQTKL